MSGLEGDIWREHGARHRGGTSDVSSAAVLEREIAAASLFFFCPNTLVLLMSPTANAVKIIVARTRKRIMRFS